MSKVTIEDISRHTGLSRGTVSRALNDRPDISHQTKQKVLDACRQLNYVPSHAARSLATGRSFAVAVLVEDLRSAFAACFLRGVIARAQAQRYAVFVTEIGPDVAGAVDHLTALARERVDGVLLAAQLGSDLVRPIADLLEKRPLIAAETVSGVNCDVLSPDYREVGRLVARHMLSGGDREVLYVHDPESKMAGARLAGFEEVCRQSGVEAGQVTLELPPMSAGAEQRMEAIRGRLEGVRFVAASNDYLAADVMQACRQAGRSPGRDIGVVGQDNELLGERITPSLTTVDLSGEEIGARAMDLAIQRVNKTRQDAAHTTQVAPMLIRRESTRGLV